MKSTKKIIIPLVILILAALAAYRLNSNREKTIADTAIASQTASEVPVKVSAARTGTINHRIATTGTLAASEELIVVSETQGKIIRINRQVGDYVRQNDVLVEVEDETVAANVLVAEANFEQQTKDLERMQRLEQGNAIAKHDLEKARIGLKKAEADLITARKALKDTKIRTPISGIVNKRMVENGEFIAGGMPVCEIVNTAILEIWIKIPEKDIFKLNKGQTAEIIIPALPGEIFSGKIIAIGEKADNSMKFDVEIQVNNPGGKQHLKAGLFSEIRIPVEASPAILIDKTALVGSMKNPSVFVAEGNQAVKKAIVVNESDDQNVEVISGLKQGEQVVISGQLNLNDGDRIKIVK
ncbi:MAG: efflux RND transporter periplasmic adaptor subunit [Prolixibacteraceae bacterium]